MAVSHVKSNPVANMTGTVTVFNSAGITTTANATDLVRPTDWNSAHNQFMTIGGNTAGVSTLSGTNIEFHGGNNVTLSGDGQTIVFSAPSQSVQTQGSVQVQGSTGAISFANGNGITFGGNASTMTASHNGLTTARASNDAIGLNSAFTAGPLAMTIDSSGLSLNAASAAGTTSGFTGGASISGSMTHNTAGLALSLSHPAWLTTAAQSNHSHGNPTLALTNLSGTTASNSAGLTLSLSAAAPGGAASATLYATGNTTQSSTGTQAVSSMVFRGEGGVSAGVSGGSVVVSGPALTSLSVTGALSASSNGSTISLGVGTVTASAIGNTTQTSSGTINLNGIVVSGAGGVSAGFSAGTLILSGATGGAGGGVAVANSQTTYTSGTVNLSAAGALTIDSTTGQSYRFSVPNTSSLSAVGNLTISTNGNTISFSVGTAAPSPVVVSAGTTSGSLSNIVFSDSNGLSFGLNGSTITGSHNGLTTAAQSNHSHGNPTLALTNLNGTTASASNGLTLSLSAAAQSVQPVAVSGQNGSYAFSTLSLSNANGISFGTSGGSAITASHNALTTARASNDAIGLNTALTANGVAWTVNSSGLSLNIPAFLTTAAQSDHSHGNPTLALTNLSGTTASNSAGLTLSLSAAAPGGGGGVGLSAGTQSVSTGTVAFANSNGMTFGMSGSNQITASYNSTQFAGTGTTFAGANISASMTLNSNGLNLSASVAAPGAAAEQNAINLLGANTSGNTTATGSTIGLSGLNLTLSGTNASQIVISAPGTSSLVAPYPNAISTNGSTISIGHATYSGYNPYHDYPLVIGQPGQGTLQFDPEDLPNCQFDRLIFGVNNTNSSNSSGSHTLSFWVGFYTRNASSLSLLTSTSTSTALTHSGTAGSYSLYSGLRAVSIPMTSTFTAGEYWIGFLSRTTSGGANGSYSNLIGSNLNSNFLGHFGSSHATTAQLTLGQGVYSATTSGMPSSVAFSQIRGSDSQAARPVYIHMASGTV
jgi:hypothetical protein